MEIKSFGSTLKVHVNNEESRHTAATSRGEVSSITDPFVVAQMQKLNLQYPLSHRVAAKQVLLFVVSASSLIAAMTCNVPPFL